MTTISLSNCARCGGAHEQLEVKPLDNPPDRYTHFAMCPISQQPIMVKIVAEQGSDSTPDDTVEVPKSGIVSEGFGLH